MTLSTRIVPGIDDRPQLVLLPLQHGLSLHGKLSDPLEGLLNVEVRLGRGLDKEHLAVFLAELLELLICNLSLSGLEVKFVSDYQEWEGVLVGDHRLR